MGDANANDNDRRGVWCARRPRVRDEDQGIIIMSSRASLVRLLERVASRATQKQSDFIASAWDVGRVTLREEKRGSRVVKRCGKRPPKRRPRSRGRRWTSSPNRCTISASDRWPRSISTRSWPLWCTRGGGRERPLFGPFFARPAGAGFRLFWSGGRPVEEFPGRRKIKKEQGGESPARLYCLFLKKKNDL